MKIMNLVSIIELNFLIKTSFMIKNDGGKNFDTFICNTSFQNNYSLLFPATY